MLDNAEKVFKKSGCYDFASNAVTGFPQHPLEAGSTTISPLPCEMAQAAKRAAELFTADVDTNLGWFLIW